MSAIQYINQYYMSRQLENEREFITECMSYLSLASTELAAAEEPSLLCIQRALLLLKAHLETFKRRYANRIFLYAFQTDTRDNCLHIRTGLSEQNP